MDRIVLHVFPKTNSWWVFNQLAEFKPTEKASVYGLVTFAAEKPCFDLETFQTTFMHLHKGQFVKLERGDGKTFLFEVIEEPEDPTKNPHLLCSQLNLTFLSPISTLPSSAHITIIQHETKGFLFRNVLFSYPSLCSFLAIDFGALLATEPNLATLPSALLFPLFCSPLSVPATGLARFLWENKEGNYPEYNGCKIDFETLVEGLTLLPSILLPSPLSLSFVSHSLINLTNKHAKDATFMVFVLRTRYFLSIFLSSSSLFDRVAETREWPYTSVDVYAFFEEKQECEICQTKGIEPVVASDRVYFLCFSCKNFAEVLSERTVDG